MRRIFIASSVVLALAGLALVGWQASAPAQAKKSPVSSTASNSPATKNNVLPVTQAVLFTSGVGYFERSGAVDGNVTIDLAFPASDINDLLKSLVVQDLGGGQVSAVGYDSFDPVDKTLKSFALDLTRNPSVYELLQQARGEKVEVDWQGQSFSGTIVGVERQRQPAGKDHVVEVEIVTLLTEQGLRSLPLGQVQRLRFLNAHLESELRRALEVLAFSHDTHKRTVRLQFTGEGKRPVRIGYVIENPIWKTSYRLVLAQEANPFLQGWAIVDNATEDDWNGVQVTLVSGRPISFLMDLYTPLYVPRPVVELELFSHLRPPMYGGALGMKADMKEAKRMQEAKKMAGFAPKAAEGFAPAPPAQALDLAKGVVTAAAAREMGDFFQYAIKAPLNLPRQKSALLPIVNEKVDAARFSIYNASVQAKHPLLGMKLKNNTALHLMQGPITVFDGSSYAGDARIPDLQPNEERLLSYAVDLGMEVEPTAKSLPDQLLTVKIVKGILYATSKYRQTKTYVAKNRTQHDRQLLIEHPVRADWTLTAPEKFAERSRDVYRFLVPIPAGKSVSQEVVEEQSRTIYVALTTIDDQTIKLYLSSNVLSKQVREALEQAIALKSKLADVSRDIAKVEKQIRVIVEDQVRIRANMERVPANSAPYQRYLKKLDEQETQIETLQEQVRTLRLREDEQRKSYEAFLLGLNLE